MACILAGLLHGQDYPIRNVITFGAPKAYVSLHERDREYMNSIRVVAVGDPLVEMPDINTEGKSFIHVGEVLRLHKPDPSFSLDAYHNYLADENITLSYEEYEDDGSANVS